MTEVDFPTQLPIPREVLSIARKLEDAGHETWCVGGAVRDNLLGYDNKDFDLATAATPEDVQRLFRRTIPVGVEHGTVAVLDQRRRPHEVTTFRRDVKTDGRHAVVEFGASLEEDLARRDFTINAIAYHPLRHEWRDPCGGRNDLAAKIVRAVGDPAQRFREDYLRILRALRFAARFGFEIDAETWSAAQAHADGLRYLSAERVREEWFGGVATARDPGHFVELWRDVGALARWMPEVSMAGEGTEGLRALGQFPVRDPVLMTAYLSADPGATLGRLKCSNLQMERGRRIEEFRRDYPLDTNAAAVRSWMATVGPAIDDLLAIAQAEGRGGPLAAAVADVRSAGAPLTLGDLALDGNDLLELGVPPGPIVGEVLRELLGRVLENPAENTREAMQRAARRILQRGSKV